MTRSLRTSMLACHITLLVLFLRLTCPAMAASTGRVITATDAQGNRIALEDNRKPALYTQDFGDCQGDSLINVTRFDAAYYRDNMTILFHLAGNTALTNESLMLYIGVYAYGEPRFDLTFNPCNANIWSLCPLNGSVPIEANGIIPISQSDVSGIPPLALTIPDFEGQAILRIFANSTQSQIGCYSAVVTNGATFSHPEAVGTTLGIFTLVAICSSIATALYGDGVAETRKHYAHSLSVFVVFAVFHHIFFTGALSVNWPSVLVAFWSNYAWSAGMIFSNPMQNSINQFLGANRGNISMVGAAASGVSNDNLGGGYQISQIYKRAALLPFQTFEGIGQTLRPRSFEHTLAKRDLLNISSGFSWYGQPVRPGLPLPGNFSGFAGTVGKEGVPASNAFLTAFLWFLVTLLCIAVAISLAKWVMEGLYRLRVMKTPRLAYFRANWVKFVVAALLRTVFICFFMFMFLTMFQFTLGGSAGVLAIAAIVLTLFLVGMVSAVAYAFHYRLRSGKDASKADRPVVERTKKLGLFPGYGLARLSSSQEKEETTKSNPSSVPWWQILFAGNGPDKPSIHEDEEYMRKFGWLASRFRRSKWWFFALWLFYEFVRACFYGIAAGHALTQVFGLLVVEFIAFVAIIFLRPFEGKRLNLLTVYMLGFSKVTTVALSSAFDTRFNLQRIPTTIIGIVIIVIQGILTVLVMVAIVLGAISSYMSLTRNRDDFKPKKWAGFRARYLAHIEQTSSDQPPPPPPRLPSPPPTPSEPTEPYFKVSSVRRQPKIEDDDDAIEDFSHSKTSLAQGILASRQESRAQSIRSQASMSNLPYGAKRHRASWSSRDFYQDMSNDGRLSPVVHTRMSDASMHDTAARSRSRAQSVMERAPSRTATPIHPSRTNTPDLLNEKQRSNRSSSTSGFDKKSESRVDRGMERSPLRKESEA